MNNKNILEIKTFNYYYFFFCQVMNLVCASKNSGRQ